MTTDDERREGDDRPVQQHHLSLLPDTDEPFRWLPKHGEPSCVAEWLSQNFVKTLAYWPVYTAIVSTLVLVIMVFHPWGLGVR